MKWSIIKNDGVASIVVFLVAMPLCLGIALASGAPLFSGIIAGIVGGVVVGFLSDSQVSVSGPAAGMVAVVLAGTATLGSFQAFLLALFIAGMLQIGIGILRVGFIADYVPSTVIQGLLAAIGILIIIKQLPLAFGFSRDTADLMSAFQMAQENFSLSPLWRLIHHISWASTFITVWSIALLLVWPKLPWQICKKIPAAIMVVVSAVLFNSLFLVLWPDWALPNSHLVNVPVSNHLTELFDELPHPAFSAWSNINIYLYAGMIAIVASLETLLNLEAAEKIDPKHRYCSRNKELIAQGIGNAVSGLAGGLPITSVIVRTSVNIQSGNQSKLSTIIHGGLLLFSLIVIPTWLNKIPLAALAAILIVTGYKLASVSLFKNMYAQGKSYFAAFITTVVAIVFTNLLLGVIIGLCIGLFFILRQNSRNRFLRVKEQHASGEVLRLIFPQQLTFLNKAAIVSVLKDIPRNSRVLIDAHNTDYIDRDILEIIREFKTFQAPHKNIALNLEGIQSDYYLGNQNDFITVTTLDVQNRLTPNDILQVLQEGNQRFVNNTPIHKDFRHQISATSMEQHPIAVVLSCIDSRVPVEHIFDLTIGDVLVVRIAGNIINTDVLASIEYACEIAGAKLIMILGHRHCGAITAACDDVQLGHLSSLLTKLKPAILAEKETLTCRRGSNADFVDRVACIHVDLMQTQLYQNSDILDRLLSTGRVGLIGAMYDVATGNVVFDHLVKK